MSIQEPLDGRDKVATVCPLCPGCHVRMTYKTVIPLMSPVGIDEITYQCPKCGTETKRNVRSA
jgi:C4-type Zn-finger protein